MPGIKGRSGRRPKPTASKALAGNPGKRKLNKDEPNFALVTDIDPPEWLSQIAQEMWSRVVPSLLGEQVLCVTDLHNVEAFCNAYSNWRAAQEAVVKHGQVVETPQGGLMKNPALTAVKEAAAQMVTFGSLLGLDPASRSRLTGGKKDGAKNPFAGILNG